MAKLKVSFFVAVLLAVSFSSVVFPQIKMLCSEQQETNSSVEFMLTGPPYTR